MQAIQARFNYLFRSTKGLILVAIALISIVTAVWGMLSGPLKEWGVSDVAIRLYGMRLVEAEREGRIILLYHTIAMAVVAIETYLITALVPMKPQQQANINATITVGYIVSLIFGLWFGYFGHNFVFHGLFIFGQSLVFFAGVMLAAALWPWRKEYHVTDPDYAHTRGGVDLERVAFFAMAVATLGSAIFGAVPGSLWGRGQETFLAEEIVREPFKASLQLAVIGHLHIMLALIAVALTLILSRYFDFKGRLHKIAMPLMIVGTLIITGGVWAVVPFEVIAHIIINVGSFPVLIGSWLLVYFGWRKIARARLAVQGISRPSRGQVLAALLHDPLRFGGLWQMVYMNFVVTAIGIFMAIRLDKVIRQWPLREEQVGLTGHWHILAGIIATIILLLYADLAGLRGKARQWFGWIVIVASDIAFAAVSLFETKRLYVTEASQQPLVNLTMLVTDAALCTVLIALAALMVWRLVDLFRRNGRWAEEAEVAR
ncbi:MAG: hypothetical protein NT169_01700 [Chloroflexi bacterium]|nr:hypothetical protein [Chloroflexota bacterium]